MTWIFWIACWTVVAHPGLQGPAPEDGTRTAAQRWALVEELRISGETSRYLLSNIFEVEIGPRGEIYVGDESEARVLVFDSTGRLLRRIGGRGYGPGEFQRPAGMGWVGDTLWVTDADQLRVSYFDAAGTHIETARISGPAVPPGLPTAPDCFLADGSVAVELRVGSRQIAVTREITALPVLRMRRDGHVLDTLALLPLGYRVVHLPWRGGNLFSAHPVPMVPFWAASPNGSFLVFVDLPVVRPGRSRVGTIRIVFRRPDGAIAHAVEYPFEPRDLPAEVTDSITGRLARALSNALPQHPPIAGLLDVMRRQVRFPPFRPPVTRLVVGRDSTVWLRREDAGANRVTWDVLAWSGSAIGHFEAPPSLVIYQAERGRVWGILPDDDGVPQVIRYRVAVQ